MATDACRVMSDIKSDFLTCRLCNNVYSQPKALPCLHTFCRSCLANHVCKNGVKAGDGTMCVFCPNCRQICDIPTGGVASLPDNLMLAKVMDIVHRKMTSYCDACWDEQTHTVATATSVCLQCEEFLCSNCARAHKKARRTREHSVLKLNHLRELYHQTPTSTATSSDAAKHTHAHAHAKPHCSVKRLASFGKYSSELREPVGIAVNRADDVIVANGNNDISVYSLDGRFKRSLNQNLFYGNAEKSLSNKCVAMTMEGYLAVSMRKDIHSNNVTVLVKQTMAQREVATCSVVVNKPLLCEPHGVTVLSNNSTVVSDVGKHCLYLFNAENKFVSKFGRWGSRSSQLKYPYYITSNASDEILISDYGNHCIKILRANMRFKLRCGAMGKQRGQFMHPTGLATNSAGDIFVCDRDNHRLQMLDSTGKFLALVLRNTCKNGVDVRPLDCAVTRNDHLVVLLTGVEGEDYVQIQVLQCAKTPATNDVTTQQLYALRESLDSLYSPAVSTPLYTRKTPLPPVRTPAGDERSVLKTRQKQELQGPDIVAGHHAFCSSSKSRTDSSLENHSALCIIL